MLGDVIRNVIFTCEHKIVEFSFNSLQRYVDIVFLGRLSSINFEGSTRIENNLTKCVRRIYAAFCWVSDSIRVDVGFARATLFS